MALNKNLNKDDTLSINETASILHVHPNTLRNWDRQGRFTAARLRQGERFDFRYDKLKVVRLAQKMHALKTALTDADATD